MRITHNEAQLVVLMKDAIMSMSDLVLYVENHKDLVSEGALKRIRDADYFLNSAEDTFISDEQAECECRGVES